MASGLLVACGGGGGGGGDPQPSQAAPDRDSDGIADASDNCPDTANANQANLDFDGAGDACDDDIDGDGVANADDAFPRDANERLDTDGDGIGNVADADDDNDGVIDSLDACPLDPTDSLDYDNDGVCNFADTEPLVVSFTPSDFALFADEVETKPITVTATIAGPDIGFLRIEAYRIRSDGPSGSLLETQNIDVYDDGANGDAVAGDGVFTRTFAFGWSEATDLTSFANDSYYENLVYPLRGILRVFDTGGAEITDVAFVKGGSFNIAVIDRSVTAAATQRSAELWTTSSIANMITQDFRFAPTQLAEITAAFCANFPGVTFDFLSVQNYDTAAHPIVGGDWAVPVSNDVEGIGMLPFDDSAEFGCPGLQLVTYHDTDGLMGTRVTHEFGHRYNAYFNDDGLDLSNAQAVSHWGHTSICDGQMTEGRCLVEQNDGTLSVEATRDWITPQFSDFALYAWGLIPKASIQPQWFVTDPSVTVTAGGVVQQADAQLVSIDDVVAAYGERVPAQGQTQYRVGFIVVSDRVLSDAEFAFESLKAEYFGSGDPDALRPGPDRTPPPLPYATKGLASFETLLPPLP